MRVEDAHGLFKQRRFTIFFFPHFPPDHFLNNFKIQSKHPHQCQLIIWMETEVKCKTNMERSCYG